MELSAVPTFARLRVELLTPQLVQQLPDQPASGQLQVIALGSDNQPIVPDVDLMLTGTGMPAVQSVTFTPLRLSFNQQGIATATVTAVPVVQQSGQYADDRSRWCRLTGVR